MIEIHEIRKYTIRKHMKTYMKSITGKQYMKIVHEQYMNISI